MKILIYKEKLEEELNKLGQYTSYDEWEQGRKTGKMEVLESILQQGEEYNENETIEFAEWILQNNIEKIKTPSQAKYWETDDTLNNKFNTTQELFKIYKDERGIDASIIDFFTSKNVILYDSCGKFQIGDTIKLTK